MEDGQLDNFHGVYLLYCRNNKSKGRIYIGYTVNPQRRIRQHNKGKDHGGAWKTSNKGPWDMVLIVHGFPNSISALRFEWAWQHPSSSRRLRHVEKKKRNETSFQFHFRLMCSMLRTPPWAKLPLTLQWINDSYFTEFEPSLQPPPHMPICFGEITLKKKTTPVAKEGKRLKAKCPMCSEAIKKDNSVQCANPKCKSSMCMICLASGNEELLPVEVKCPSCYETYLWNQWICEARTHIT